MAGDLTVQVAADIGGFGAKVGPPVTYNWTRMPDLVRMLPWLCILSLLALKSNRAGRAWWIILPIGLWVLAGTIFTNVAELEQEQVVAVQMLEGAVFGLGCIWLLGQVLGRWRGLARFLMHITIMVAMGVLAFFVSADHEAAGEAEFQVAIGAIWCGAGLAVAIALTVVQLACRGEYRPSLICISSFLGLLVGWGLIVFASREVTPFFWQGQDFNETFLIILALTTFSFVLLLSFLLLSFFNSLYRDRLKTMLRLSSKPASPPVVAPLPQ